VALAALLAIVLWRTMTGTRGRDTVSYSEFTTEYLAKGQVHAIRVIGDRLEATLKPAGAEEVPERKLVYLGSLQITPELAKSWAERGVNVEFRPSSSAWRTLLNALPYAAILVVIFFLFRQAQSGQRGIFTFGKSRARELTEDVPTITFAEVAGVEEAKQELQEIVEFLREPGKFQRLGGKIPRGVLMVGPPGTGKTYLARAVAGEAGVPFFNISGSDFVEMFVGVGASRVRDLFERAKAKASCIVFIDEIDAVGRHRGAGLGGGHDEREQTLNQLLVEMDGFDTNSTVILIAATNRPDVLDPALLRPGRFDRQVVLDMPDVRGREGILKIHTRDVILARDVDLHALAKGTPGLSGADLRNLVNEAALLAARNNRREVGMFEFEMAKEKVMWGVERRSLVMSDEERRVTAFHEAGHALAAIFTPGADPVHKVTIIPRGRALGLTAYLPDDERHTVSQSWCTGKLVGILGGRAAEELVFGEITNGAAGDLEMASALARRMVCEWGMSPRVGPVAVGGKNEEIFIGRELVQSRALSERTLQIIDDEVRRIIDGALRQASALFERNRAALDAIADALLVREVLDRKQIDQIIQPLLAKSGTSAEIEPTSASSRGPIVVERPASSAPSARPAPPRPKEQDDVRAGSDVREGKQHRPHPEERPPALEPAEEPTVVFHDESPLPSPKIPEKSAASPKPMTFGRKPKMVKRFGLPSSEVPETGISVSSVVGGHLMVYGRPLRAASNGGAQSKSAQPADEQPHAPDVLPADADAMPHDEQGGVIQTGVIQTEEEPPTIQQEGDVAAQPEVTDAAQGEEHGEQSASSVTPKETMAESEKSSDEQGNQAANL